jgi:hypothetical protein
MQRVSVARAEPFERPADTGRGPVPDSLREDERLRLLGEHASDVISLYRVRPEQQGAPGA